MPSYKVGVIGATGAVGQRFLQLLEDHPWFDVTALAASSRSAGKTYREACRWHLDAPMPASVADMVVQETGGDLDADVLFSAVPGGLAGDMERAYAARGCKVFSNARDNRRAKGVPLVVTEVNPEHFVMLEERETDGFVVTNGNCSGIVATLSLAPLHDAFGIEAAHIVTLQAMSGAGYPGLSALDMMDNLVPYIGGEEDKLETELAHQLGTAHRDGTVDPVDFPVSATCTRVPVIEGHSMAIHLKLAGDPSAEDVLAAFREYRGKVKDMDLPTAPARPVVVHEAPDRPQPRRDRDLSGGMAVSVGRVRADPLMSVKYFTSGSNTIRGAAGQSILNAEYAAKKGWL